MVNAWLSRLSESRIAFVAANLVVLLFSTQAFANEMGTLSKQMHARFGYLSTTISGQETSGGFAVANTFDFDVEFFTTMRRAWLVKSTFAYDLPTSRMVYMSIGIGHRFYLGPAGMSFDQSQGGFGVKSIPTWRYYVGIDASIATVIVRGLGSVLTVSSTMFEPAVSGGVIYQLGRNLGLEFQAGLGMGMGFSSVSVSATTMRGMLGATYAF